MTSFISKAVILKNPAEKIFEFLKDLSRLEKILPEQVENKKSTHEECTFFIKNIGNLGIRIDDIFFPNQIKYISTENSKVKFYLYFCLKNNRDNTFSASFEIRLEINAMIEMMVKRPLSNFVNILSTNLQNTL